MKLPKAGSKGRHEAVEREDGFLHWWWQSNVESRFPE